MKEHETRLFCKANFSNVDRRRMDTKGMNNFITRTNRPARSSEWLRKWLYVTISVFAIVLVATRLANAQTVDIDRVVAELEPEIQRTLVAGNIPSASIAIIAGDRVI